MELENKPPRCKSAQTVATRAKILRCALDLFNAQGFYQVTTHDIAAKAAISPGNLYYHFKNKEQIVRELFLKMDIFSEVQWLERGPLSLKGSFLDFILFYFSNLENYHFFFRDFSTILQHVPAMAKLWRDQYNFLQAVMRKAAKKWVEIGILKEFESAEAMDVFIESCWILTNFSTVHFELTANKPLREARKKETELLVRFLQPYHTPKGQRALALLLPHH